MLEVRGIRRSFRLATVTLAGAGLLVLCVGNASAATRAVDGAAVAHASGSTLNIAEAAAQPTLDPATDIQFLSDELASVYDTLVTVLPGGKIAPDLATSWKVNGNSITFKLRKGVKFQDGTPFNAQAVKAELDRIQNPATQATNSKSVLGPYASSTVVNPYTITITWSAPYGGALIDLGNADLSIPSPKAAAAGILATHPVGTGPYEFESYTPGTELVLKRNPNYTSIRPDLQNKRAPKYAKVVFQYVTNEATRANLLQTGGTDLTRLDGTYADAAFKNSSLQHRTFTSISEYWAAINSKQISDPAVRNAIFAAINRKALIAVTSGGFGSSNSNAIPTSIPGWSKTIKVPGYNPTQAKKYLQQAGYSLNSDHVMAKDGHELTFEILSSNQDPYPAMDQLIQDELSQVGIKTNIVTQVFASVVLTRRQGNQGIYVGTYGILDPMGAMKILFSCDTIPTPANPLGTNITFWCNSQYDKLIAAATAEGGNETKRNANLVAAQKILMAARTSMTLFQPAYFVAASKSVKGIFMQPDGILKMNDLRPGS